MSPTPDIRELYSAQIPALAMLAALGWEYLSPVECLEMRGGNRDVVLRSVLVDHLRAHRFDHKGGRYPLSTNAIDQIVRELTAPPLHDGLMTANERLYNALTWGVTVTEFVDGARVGVTVPVVDWRSPAANSFIVTEELEVLSADGTHTRRPDLVGYVNGLPLVVVEAKRPDSGNPNRSMVEEGISQTLRNQRSDEIPLLFAYAQLLVSISATDARYGTTRTERKFWASWKEEEFDEAHFTGIKNRALSADPRASLMRGRVAEVQSHFEHLWSEFQAVTDQDRLLIGMLSPERLLEFVRLFILFTGKDKLAARAPQVFAVKALLRQIAVIRPDGGREGGVIWHTTGAGKSFTMVLVCKALLLVEALKNCRVVVVTDRRDLEKQLSRNFLIAGAFGSALADKGGERAKATTGRDLARRIGRGSERIIFTIINKFASASKLPQCRNDSADLIVLVDEGHRSQGGENHERMRKALPNAAYIAFTGTPLLKDDKTAGKFGRIIHAYTMRDATDDGTVTPLLYEERQPLLDINETAIDNWFDKITLGLSDKQKSDLKEKYGKKRRVLGAMGRIELIAWDIAVHFKTNFKDLDLGLKAQVAADSKLSAVRYKKALDATGLVTSAVVISPPDSREGNEDVDESELPEVQQWWKDNVTGDPEAHERRVIEDFSAEGRPDILIVVDKLLTGFDEPRNAVLYIDKPLKQHNLMQAIARVNRLHEEKKFGLLIDYRGILRELDSAVADYQDLASRTQGGFDLDDIDRLYGDVSTEYKRLPGLHDALLALFSEVRNKLDIEQYRSLLAPRLENDAAGVWVDTRQNTREDFYEALTAFGLCLKTALSSRSFFEDGSVTEHQIATYKSDLMFFSGLRRIAKADAQETVDFSIYEDQIRKLVDRHVVGEAIKPSEGLLRVGELGRAEDVETWSEEKTRNETDIIKSRLTKTIEQGLADDPYARKYFSQLLREAIAQANALFDHPRRQYAVFKDLEDQVATGRVEGTPARLLPSKHATAYYGVFRLIVGDEHLGGSDHEAFVNAALDTEDQVRIAVAENSLNPQNVEAAIRKALLPRLFTLVGLDQAKAITDEIVSMTRVGLARGTLQP